MHILIIRICNTMNHICPQAISISVHERVIDQLNNKRGLNICTFHLKENDRGQTMETV